MTAVRAVVRGRVQGVGFRWAVKRAADAQGVTGWVRNRRDGSVEAVLRGTQEAVDAVLERVAEGPPAARVDDVSTSPAPENPDATSFELHPTL